MKRFTLFSSGIALLFSLSSLAQEVENKLQTANEMEKSFGDFQSQTHRFDFPKKRKASSFSLIPIIWTFVRIRKSVHKILKETNGFPNFKNFNLSDQGEEWAKTKQRMAIIWNWKRNISHMINLNWGSVIGWTSLEVTSRLSLGQKSCSIRENLTSGPSITNTMLFPQRLENNVIVNSNWFSKFGFSMGRSNPI